jgi:hypothetical protein
MDAALPQDAIPTEKKVHGNKGRKPTDKQLEGLKKGMEALKARREAAKQQKAEKKDESSDDEAPPAAPAPKTKKLVSADKLLEVIPLKPARTRRSPAKPAAPKGSLYASKEDFEAFKSQMMDTLKTTPIIKEVEKPVEKIVDREVVREVPVVVEKKLTGSSMLDAIFFK